MVAIIALFFPAVISVWIIDAVHKVPMSNRKFLYLYSLNVMLINLGCFALKRWIRHSGEYPIGDMTPTSAINYIVIAVLLSIALALLEVFLCKKVRIHIESNIEDGTEDEKTHE